MAGARRRRDGPSARRSRRPRGSWSYAELHAAARAGAAELARRGAGAGARVAIALPAGLDFAQALHACLLLGAVAVPRRPASRRERARAHRCRRASCSSTSRWARAPRRRATRAAGPRTTSTPPRVVIHTSGTTAAPRPVELTYGNFLWSALGSAVALGLDPARALAVRAAALARRRPLDPAALGDLRHDRRRARALRDRPRAACARARQGDAREPRRHDARAAARRRPERSAGAALRARPAAARSGRARPARARRWRARQPHLRPHRELLAGHDHADRRDRTCAVERGAAAVLHARAHRRRRRDPRRGPTVAPAALASDGWLHTGDLGDLDAHGRLHVSGRKADTIVSGGENVAPAEVEAVLEAHPHVLEAAVLGRADPEWGEAVTAIVVARAGARWTTRSCARTALARWPPTRCPRASLLAAEPLPRTRSGKLLRRELRLSFDANAHRQASLADWEEAAPGWVRRQALLRELGAPVSHWMIEAVSPQPGQRVLELAAGLGETGMLAAELVAPLGGVIISDQAEAMLEGARARAASSASATSSSRCSAANGSTCRSPASTPCSAAGATC